LRATEGSSLRHREAGFTARNPAHGYAGKILRSAPGSIVEDDSARRSHKDDKGAGKV
jgi:hypothetical protein